MENETNEPEKISIQSALVELAQGAKAILRGESKLLRAEAEREFRNVLRFLAPLGVALLCASLAGLACTLFLVFGIGSLFGDRTWLGGLIVFAGFGTIAAILAIFAMRRFKRIHWTFPETRQSLMQESEIILDEAEKLKPEMKKSA